MSKLDSYMQGRTEGMEFALRLVKDKGIEELEASNKIKEMTLDTFTLLSVACLCDLWGFGKKKVSAIHEQDGRGCTVPCR